MTFGNIRLHYVIAGSFKMRRDFWSDDNIKAGFHANCFPP